VNREERRQPIRLSDRVELGEEYAGWWVRFRLNPPMGLLEDLDSKEVARVFEALVKICRESNYVDDDGEPIDVATTEGWRRVGSDLLGETIRAFKDTMTSPLAKRTTSSRPTSPATDESSPLVTA
jgi:hypothetical protein